MQDELLQAIVSQVTPYGSIEAAQCLCHCRQVSRAFLRVATEDALWRMHYKWNHGKSLQDFPSAFAACAQRTRLDRITDASLDRIVASCFNRIAELQNCTMDSYDRLKEHESALCIDQEWRVRRTKHPKWLSRSHWIREILAFVSRREAMKYLRLIAHSSDFAFEQGLLIFSLFQNADISAVQQKLGSLAHNCAQTTAQASEMGDARSVAMGIKAFMEENGYTAASGEEFHQLESNFVAFVLLEPRPSLPMTLVWIFSCLCERLGLVVHPVGFPSTVLAYVEGWKDPNKPGFVPFYMNVYRGRIFNREELSNDLSVHRFSPRGSHYLLDPALTRDMVMRSARNIYNSLGMINEGNVPVSPDMMYAAVYGAIATMLMLSPEKQGRQLYRLATDIIRTRFALDAPFLIRELALGILPEASVDVLLEDLDEDTSRLDRVGQREKLGIDRHRIQFRVGQIFLHKVHAYRAVIFGWDQICLASDEWQRAMGVDDLQRGGTQPFYNALCEDGSSRYVAEENIVLCEDVGDATIAALVTDHSELGANFDDYDPAARRFVPSATLRQEYPED